MLIRYRSGIDGLLRLSVKCLLDPKSRTPDNLKEYEQRFDMIVSLIARWLTVSVPQKARLGVVLSSLR